MHLLKIIASVKKWSRDFIPFILIVNEGWIEADRAQSCTMTPFDVNVRLQACYEVEKGD